MTRLHRRGKKQATFAPLWVKGTTGGDYYCAATNERELFNADNDNAERAGAVAADVIQPVAFVNLLKLPRVIPCTEETVRIER